jgi:ATP-dependent Clp protease ATP-binding subunit ClpA
MLEKFTRPARTAVEGAVGHARATTASEVRPEHLLMAILDEGDCLAVQVLERLGAAPATVREELDRRRLRYVDGLDDDDAEALRAIGIDLDEVVRRVDRNLGGLTAGRRSGSRSGRPRFARSSRKVLELALREAIALHHNYIGTEHLLLGLAWCTDRVVRDTFEHLGLDRATLRHGVVDTLRQAG